MPIRRFTITCKIAVPMAWFDEQGTSKQDAAYPERQEDIEVAFHTAKFPEDWLVKSVQAREANTDR